MGKKIVICEKPSVMREYSKVLGVSNKQEGYFENDEYIITSTVGHLITMSYPQEYDEKYAKWNLETLPFLPDDYKYEVIKDVAKQFKIVKSLYNRKDIDEIILAGDSGREGIYIQELVRRAVNHKSSIPVTVVWIDSFTEAEIKRGIRERKPLSEYQNLIDAAYARAIEDYAVGINFTRALSCKFGYKKGDKYHHVQVGRVMTCVLGMIVRRENEIKNFKETKFYKIDAQCPGFRAGWKAIEKTRFFNSPLVHDNVGFLNENDAKDFLNHVNLDKHLTVEDVSIKKEKKQAPTLFNLAELQSECSKEFKISPDETLAVAQSLYEKKLTTYPRTDARVISTAVMDVIDTTLDGLKKMGIRASEIDYIKGTDYKSLRSSKRYVDDSKITDHYAIIPTGEGSLNGLSDLEKQVYEKIVARFIAIFYPAAEYEKTEVKLSHKDNEYFFASEKRLISKGYLEVYGKVDDDVSENAGKFSVKKGDIVDSTFSISEGKTKPPKRYTSGSIILAMENAGNLIEDEELRAQIKGSGIGTSATRAEVIKKLVSIKYIDLNKKTQVLTPAEDGFIIYDIVDKTIPLLLNAEMTAEWERGLSDIEGGAVEQSDYISKINDYVTQYVNAVKDMVNNRNDGDNTTFEKKVIGKCPLCGSDFTTTRFGYGCSAYNREDENSCRFGIGEIAGKKLSEEDVVKLLTNGKTDVIKGFKSKSGKKFDALLELKEGKLSFAFEDTTKETTLTCPKCGKPLREDKYSCKCECGYSIYHTVGDKKIPETELAKLLRGEETDVIKGFKAKNGNKFDAKLAIENNKLVYKFAAETSSIPCPKCSKMLAKGKFSYNCNCGFKVPCVVANKELSEKEVKELLTGHTSLIKGFKSKAGKSFDACLNWDGTNASFEFPKK